jgi:hypothetical protein
MYQCSGPGYGSVCFWAGSVSQNRGTDSKIRIRIRIRTKMSRIRNIASTILACQDPDTVNPDPQAQPFLGL